MRGRKQFKSYVVILGLLFLHFQVGAQTLVKELKKKNFGSYLGEVPAYYILSNATDFEVDKVQIKVQLSATDITMKIGRILRVGTYTILFKGKDYYVLNVLFEGEDQLERFVVYEKRKTMLREGNPPQPNVTLQKLKK